MPATINVPQVFGALLKENGAAAAQTFLAAAAKQYPDRRDPEFMWDVVACARLAVQAGQTDAARAIIDEYVDPKDVYSNTLLNKIGAVLYEIGDFARAQPYYQAAVNLAPNNAVFQSNLGRCLLAQEQYAAAQTYLQRAVELDPQKNIGAKNRAAIWYAMGVSHRMMQNYPQSLRAFKKAAGLSDHVNAHLGKAITHALAGRPGAANRVMGKITQDEAGLAAVTEGLRATYNTRAGQDHPVAVQVAKWAATNLEICDMASLTDGELAAQGLISPTAAP